MAFTHALSTNRYGEANLIVSTSAANGTHKTLAGAMADAVSGQTIFLRDSVTENVIITPGVNITGWNGGTLNVPSITGTLTMTAAGTSNISGLHLVTNSAAIIAVTGSAPSILNVYNCYLNCSNNTGINFSSSSASAVINIVKCVGDLGTTGIGLFTHSSSGGLYFSFSDISNTGASTTASTASAGLLNIFWTNFNSTITTSSTNALGVVHSYLDCTAINTPAITVGGSGSNASSYTYFASGTASAISVGATFNIAHSHVFSSNTNAMTGAGTIVSTNVNYTGTSHKSNVTTQTGGAANGLTQGTDPSVGMIGEQISASASLVATSTTAITNVASIALTPGVWDVSAIGFTTNSANATTIYILGISTANNTLPGLSGDQRFQLNTVSSVQAMSGVVPQFRVTISANTTYYVNARTDFSSGTSTLNGRITGTRVG